VAKKKAKTEEVAYDSVGYWASEIAAAKKREKDYRTQGKRIREIYAGDKKETTPFNILFSNTEVILPSLYSQVPRPVVERRFKDGDPIGQAAALAGQKGLEFLLDTNIDGYETFHDGMKNAVLDGILPGRGVTSIKYDADVRDVDEVPVVQSELVCLNSRSWDRTFFGYAKKWSAVPWIAYEEYIDKEEATEKFGAAIAGELEYTQGEREEDDKSRTKEDTGERRTATVYQIWDKAGGRKIRYVCLSYTDRLLKVSDDTLGLTGFFDTPRPLMFVDKTNDMVPTPLYALYENQATELNSLTRRINKLIAACKARGVYDATLGDTIGDLMESDDNELVPTDKSASLAAEKGLDNAIWFMPLETILKTLQQLYVSRESCKQVIYEIMGISDIIRGASKASETLGAQQLKSQWGTLRLKNKQAEVQRYSRDLLRMMLEVAAAKFSEDTWSKMTGLPYLTQPQYMQLQQQAQAMQQQAMQVQQQAAATGQQIPPQVAQQAQQQLQQLQQQLQAPQWKQILELLNDDLQRSYRIDIETNSTIEPEAAEDQKNISELMTAMGQFLNGVGPMVQEGIMPFEVAKTMLTSITRRFRFGRDIEDQIAQMQPPKPKDDGAEAKAAQDKIASEQEKGSLKAQVDQLSTMVKSLQEQLKLSQKAAELDNRERVLNDEEARLKLEKQAAQESITGKVTVENAKFDAKKKVGELESKHAQEKAKDSVNVAKTVDTKLAGGVEKMSQLVSQMTTMQSSLLQTVAEQSTQMQAAIKAMSAPRRRKAIRGPDGMIQETVDELAN
jgi:hypothetical protein